MNEEKQLQEMQEKKKFEMKAGLRDKKTGKLFSQYSHLEDVAPPKVDESDGEGFGPEEPAEKVLSDMSKSELMALAEERGVEIPDGAKKGDLVELLSK